MIAADKAHSWHPFTQMRDWCAPEHEPLVLVSGEGAILRDSEGREYLDGNSSIWTNLHGHNHPRINAAIRAQLDRVAHTSFLGFTNPPASQLAAELAALIPGQQLPRVFLGDDGSTAIEVALKITAQYWQLIGQPQRTRFIAFHNAYHGDTMGASSLGGVSAFHSRFSAWQFPVGHIAGFEELESGVGEPQSVAAVIIEPLMQGAAGMRLWPKGLLTQLRQWCDANGALLIFDEVMTGFGRTGKMFAGEHENVMPDLLAVAKGLSGGYLPLSATLVRERIYEAFLGGYEEMKTLFYGHSFTGSQLGCAAALANLAIFREENTLAQLQPKIALLTDLLDGLKNHPHLREIRQCGFMAGIEVAQADGTPFDWRAQTGSRICNAARAYGLLTRPIRDTMVLMPPYCTNEAQLEQAVVAIRRAIDDVVAS
ncbi:MAG: adenosylmethionine--8-amino-7-oxononanoate transaminase [Chthoniobacteraceae bacterium]